ncbi:MAG: HD domain-containing protein [bacterium]|nr:HD domain-containing protein [bacterium]
MRLADKTLIKSVEQIVKQELAADSGGHDWFHVWRVWTMARHLQTCEGGDGLVIELAALLHDIADWKSYGGDDTVGPRKARELLESFGAGETVIVYVCEIIQHLSFKGAGVKDAMLTLEGRIVQDADRLDAIGALGVARAFAYGGASGRLAYDPAIKPVMHKNKKAYVTAKGTVINHFFEKLLLLKNRMNTKTAKKIANGRHRFLARYLDQFFAEWNGRR